MAKFKSYKDVEKLQFSIVQRNKVVCAITLKFKKGSTLMRRIG